MTKTGDAARPPMDLDTDTVIETLKAKSREITIGAIVVLAAAGGIWLWRESEQKKAERAEIALNGASNSFYSGNMALAETDLKKVVDRYAGTTAGTEASMMLAQTLYSMQKFDDGIKVLVVAQATGSGTPFGSAIEGLIASGNLEAKKYDEAIKHYLAAADKAQFPADKDMFRADAARAMMVAGKKDDAKKIWSELASKLDSPNLGEAKIRLGELEAEPAKK
jgi:predicted negative regulator of RcsB-dependent stress response